MIANDLYNEFVTTKPRLRPYLSAHTFQTFRPQPNTAFASLYPQNWRQLAAAHQATPLTTKVERLLHITERNAPTPGAWDTLDLEETALRIDAFGNEEVIYLLHHMRDTGLLDLRSTDKLEGPRNASGEWLGRDVMGTRLTFKGWDRLQPSSQTVDPGSCFVAMSFAERLKEPFLLGILPAIEQDCGYRVVRVDFLEHNDNINDRILAEIRRAQFVVADFTGHNAGAYFEAGFARGLGREVIWTCHHDHFGQTHFDTKSYNHIVWTDVGDLRTRLRDRVLATIGRFVAQPIP